MRQVPKITGDKYDVFRNEFEALGSPRTILSEYLGVSKSYLNKWLLSKSIPVNHFDDIILFFAIHRLTNELPAKKPKRGKNSLYELKIGNDVRKVMVLEQYDEKVDEGVDIVVTVYKKRLEIKFLEGKSSLEQQELYNHIFNRLYDKEAFEVEIVRSGVNSYRFITDDNDIESLLIKINASTSYKLFLKKISEQE